MVSFIYTEKIADMFIDKDKLMMTIKEESPNYEIEPVNATIENNTIIPGLNGLKVNTKGSYKQMKKYGLFNNNLLEFKQIKPKIKLKDNYDKYIISGNKIKKSVSLIFLVYKDSDIDSIINILEQKNIKANFFVDGYWFENNNEKVIELINNGYIIGNLSYNLNYNDGAFIWMDTIIKRIGKQKQRYCYAEEENKTNIEICALNKNFTIKPIVIKDNYMKNVKENLTNGSIMSFNISSSLKQELPIIINYINSKGYQIENLNNLLSEENI